MVEETLYRSKSFFSLAFHHVTGQGPRGTSKTQNGNLGADGFHDAPDGFWKKASICLRVKNLESVDVRLGTYRIRQVWTGVAEFQLQPHGFGGNQNVRENDDRINAQPAKGLEGDFDRKLGRLANVKECVLCTDLAVFRKVAASLAHHPDRNSRKGVPTTGTKE